MATFDQAFPKSVYYFGGDELAANVFLTKYALTDPQGNILEETPSVTHRRLAKEFARIEKKYKNSMSEDEIFDLMDHYKYVIAQGSPTSAIGNPYQIMSSSNCFVVPPPVDSYGGILLTDQQLVQIAKRRGGVGFDISNIRPKNAPTSNAAKTSDGIGIFMERYSNSCREVAQNGRRGALLLSLSVHHPDIRTFINIKKDKKKVTGANISIRMSDEFMLAVKNDTDVQLRWPCELSPGTIPIYSENVNARKIWTEIVDAAWQSAEPGLLFWDTVLRNSPADYYKHLGFGTTSTNPCGEIVLSNYDSCRLMVTNLLSFVNNPFTSAAYFDFKLFDEVVQKAQRLMDDMIDIELECIDRILMKILQDPEAAPVKDVEMHLWQSIRKACVEGRRTGLGMTAVGDAVAAMSLRYGSKESIEFVESVYKQNAISSYASSILMAQERGSFPVWDINEKDHVFISKILKELSPTVQNLYRKHGRRNIANNTTAPAGSLSILTQTTSGIENAFMLESVRRKKRNPQDKNFRVDFVDQSGDEWQEFKTYHHQFKRWMEISGKTDVKDSPYYGALTADVDWVQGVELQAAAQRWIDHSISRTTNLPKDVPKTVVSDVYFKAWESGCKGITVYRDGSRSGVIVSKDEAKANKLDTRQAPKRPPTLDCDIHHVNVKGKPYTVLVGKLDGTPYEVFGGHPLKDLDKSYKVGKIQKASHGKVKPATYNLIVKNGHEDIIEDIASAFDNPTEGAFTRVLSTALRHGTPVQYLVEQILKGEKDTSMAAFSKVISRVLKHYIADGVKSHGDKICGSCGQDGMVYQEGCLSCKHCGYSKCG
jgi:ribonucleoside-diphosphate reductase alpha chain